MSLPAHPWDIPTVAFENSQALADHKAERRANIVGIFIFPIIAAAGLGILAGILYLMPDDSIMQTLLALILLCLLYLVPIAVGLAVLGFIWRATFGHWLGMRATREQHFWERSQQVIQAIGKNLADGGGFWWTRPCNWDRATLIYCDGALAIVSFSGNWISYINAQDVRDMNVQGLETGSSSQSRGYSNSIGGIIGELYLGTTRSDISTQTVNHYEYIIDIYTRVIGHEHLILNYGADSNAAKKTYATLQNCVFN